jgi:hypothetical protein
MSGCCALKLCPDEFSKNLLYIKCTCFELSDLDSAFVIRYKDKMLLKAVDTAFFYANAFDTSLVVYSMPFERDLYINVTLPKLDTNFTISNSKFDLASCQDSGFMGISCGGGEKIRLVSYKVNGEEIQHYRFLIRKY